MIFNKIQMMKGVGSKFGILNSQNSKFQIPTALGLNLDRKRLCLK